MRWGFSFGPTVGSYRTSLVAQTVKNPPAMQEIHIQFSGWEDLLEGRAWQSGPVFLLGESPQTEEPSVHGVAKESDMTEQLTHFFFQGSYKRVDEV